MSSPGSPPAPLAPSGRIQVLQVIGNAIVGGMESWVERLVQHLPSERFGFTALCPFESVFTERLRRHGVEVWIAPMPDDPPWATLQMAAALVGSRGIHLLHAHLPPAHLLAGIVGRLTHKPVVATIHGRQLTTLDLEVHRATGTHLSVVCRPSYFHALGLGVEPDRLSCEPNGVDTEMFRPANVREAGAAKDAGDPAKTSVRGTLGLTRSTPLVGFVGRLSPEKGPEIFVRAAMLLHRRLPEVHAVLVGEGPMRGELGALVQGFGLQDRVHFLGVRHDMPAVYRDLDLVVSCSNSEAMPLALMEAMASALPTIATRVGGVPDIVAHGCTGWLVNPRDVDEVAMRCETLLSDPGLCRQMGRRARARVVEHFELRHSVDRVGQLLSRLAHTSADMPPAPRSATQAKSDGGAAPSGDAVLTNPSPALTHRPLANGRD